MIKYNITTQGTYQKNGEEKKTYPQVGKLVEFEATGEKKKGFILELNMFPVTKFYVFEDDKSLEASPEAQKSPLKVVDDETGSEIPF